MKKYNDYLKTIEVSDEQHENLIARLDKPAKKRIASTMPMYAGLATAALLCVVAIPLALNAPGVEVVTDPPSITTTPTEIGTSTSVGTDKSVPYNTTTPAVVGTTANNPTTTTPATVVTAPPPTATNPLRGLPANKFRLNEIPLDPQNPEQAGCMVAPKTKLQELFSHNLRQSFVFVKVTNTEVKEVENPRYFSGAMTSVGPVPKTFITQKSSLQILSNVWSSHSVPTSVSVTQTIQGYGTITNALRKDGVYLLPLYVFEGEWYIHSEWDVLFEVDDNGKIWSHSQGKGFNRFDGMDAAVLANAITDLTSDKIFKTAISTFGQTMQWDYTLAEITISLETRMTQPWGGSFPKYDFNVDKILVQTQTGTKLQLGNTTAMSWDNGVYETGSRYLTFFGDNFTLNSMYSAKIGSNGRISAVPEPVWELHEGDDVDEDYEFRTVFHELYGKTPAEVAELAGQVAKWYKLHA